MLIVGDVNTIWRKLPFRALGQRRGVLGLAPANAISALRPRGWSLQPASPGGVSAGMYREVPVRMLPGWASKIGWMEQPRLWSAALKACRDLGVKPEGLVVTSPHYLPLVRRVARSLPTMYYASDDYRGYAKWNPLQMARLERQILGLVDHAVFVSTALAERAARENPRLAAKIHVSMNATDAAFFPDPAASVPTPPPAPFTDLPRPIAGVVGAFNERIDLELLLSCAQLDEVGTIVLVGDEFPAVDVRWTRLLDHPKCVFVGRQPHHVIPGWMHCLDVALIPYRKSEFNRFCSPMRLFDHLASGRPILASSACDQLRGFSDVVEIASDSSDFVSRLSSMLRIRPDDSLRDLQLSIARKHVWAARAVELDVLLGPSVAPSAKLR